MTDSSTSFWAEIKKYEDILLKDQSSYCFAPLSELYRKLGLLDDAVTVARRGSVIHPDYVGGYMALGRALYDKNEFAEARTCLERVVRVTPENLLAQKLLSQIYQNEGNVAAARHALQILVDFNPEDVESRLMLDSLRDQSEVAAPVPGHLSGSAQDAIDSLSELEDGQAVYDDFLVAGVSADVPEDIAASESETLTVVSSPHHAPVSTLTLAELYESQGYSDQALTIYKALLNNDPANTDISERIQKLSGASSADPLPEDIPQGTVDDTVSATSSDEECLSAPDAMADGNDALLRALEAFLYSTQRRRECPYRKS